MARENLNVILEIERIICHEEGEIWGKSEPYLWTVFFKIDGETIAVGESLTLTGAPVVQGTPGSHGNLGIGAVASGDVIDVPSVIGEFQSVLRPIPGPAMLDIDFAGVIGVVAVLMEEDNVSDQGAEAGHQALNEAVRQALQELVASLGIGNQEVSKQQLDAMKAGIEKQVRQAVIDQQNAFENLWAWFNPDDTLGTQIWYFDHDTLAEAKTIQFSERFAEEGDWEIEGHVSASAVCPAEAAKALLDEVLAGPQASTPIDLGGMRDFRDNDYRSLPGLAAWFELAQRHAPRLAWLVVQQPSLRSSVAAMLEWADAIAREPEATIGKARIEHASALLHALANSNSRRARMDAGRALEMLQLLEGRTHHDALRLLAEISPSTHPTKR